MRADEVVPGMTIRTRCGKGVRVHVEYVEVLGDDCMLSGPGVSVIVELDHDVLEIEPTRNE